MAGSDERSGGTSGSSPHVTSPFVLSDQQWTGYPVWVEIADSARKHGIADADIWHAYNVPFRIINQAGDRDLIIGADHTGRLLELVVIHDNNEPAAIIHAMELRRSFYRYLDQG